MFQPKNKKLKLLKFQRRNIIISKPLNEQLIENQLKDLRQKEKERPIERSINKGKKKKVKISHPKDFVIINHVKQKKKKLQALLLADQPLISIEKIMRNENIQKNAQKFDKNKFYQKVKERSLQKKRRYQQEIKNRDKLKRQRNILVNQHYQQYQQSQYSQEMLSSEQEQFQPKEKVLSLEQEQFYAKEKVLSLKQEYDLENLVIPGQDDQHEKNQNKPMRKQDEEFQFFFNKNEKSDSRFDLFPFQDDNQNVEKRKKKKQRCRTKEKIHWDD